MDFADKQMLGENQELAETQERLHLALNAAEASTWCWDIVADRILWSENLEPQLGMPAHSFGGNFASFLELVYPKDRETVSQAVNRSLYEGANYHLEFRMVRADGTVRWTETRGKLECDENGRPLRLSGIDLDISERKEAEAGQRAREAELSAILDAVPGWIYIARDPSCRQMASSNNAYEELRQRQGVDPSKPGPDDERPTNFRIVKDGQEIPAHELPIQRAASTGREIRDAELTLTFADGTSIDVLGNAVPLLNDDGTSRGAVGAFIDISGLKRTERQLRETERELHEAQRLARSGSWKWYPKTDTVTWTRGLCRIFGHDPELPAPSFAEQASLYTPESLQRLRAALDKTFKTGEEYELELDVIRPDGTIARVVTHAEAKRDASGEVVMLYGSVQDLTEWKRIEEELRLATERFQVALKDTSIVVFNQDLELRYTWIYNPAFGHKAAEVIGKRDIDLFERVQDGEITEAIKREVIRSGIPRRQEVSIYWRGEYRCYDLLVEALRDTSGSIVGVTCAAIDITASKQAAEELRKSHLELEKKVEERTTALSASLAALGSEVETRKRAGAALQELSVRLLQLQDEERRRIARDLHDSAGQTLTAIRMSLSFLEPLVRDIPRATALLAELKQYTDDALRDIRTTSHLLHPPVLDQLGFQAATTSYVEELEKRSGIKTRLNLTAAKDALTKDSELALFRVLQESLTNIVRHSRSKTVDISFQSNDETATLTIRDYGSGIPAEKLKSFNETGAGVGVGLGGMRQRIRERGGDFSVISDDAGTCVTAILPISRVK